MISLLKVCHRLKKSYINIFRHIFNLKLSYNTQTALQKMHDESRNLQILRETTDWLKTQV